MAFVCIPFTIITLAVGALGQSITIPPSDATQLIGEEAKFKCVTYLGTDQQFMKWEYNGAVVYSFEDGYEIELDPTDKYSISRQGENFTLVVKDLALSDGGIYTCRITTQHYDVNLIVLAQPTITSGDVTENHHVTYTCDGQFGGPPKDVISPGHYPKMQIFLDGTLVANKGNIKELGPKNGNNAHTLQKNYSTELTHEMDKKTIKCEISTDIPAGSNTADLEIIVPENEPEEVSPDNGSSGKIAVGIIVPILIALAVGVGVLIYTGKWKMIFGRSGLYDPVNPNEEDTDGNPNIGPTKNVQHPLHDESDLVLTDHTAITEDTNEMQRTSKSTMLHEDFSDKYDDKKDPASTTKSDEEGSGKITDSTKIPLKVEATPTGLIVLEDSLNNSKIKSIPEDKEEDTKTEGVSEETNSTNGQVEDGTTGDNSRKQQQQPKDNLAPTESVEQQTEKLPDVEASTKPETAAAAQNSDNESDKTDESSGVTSYDVTKPEAEQSENNDSAKMEYKEDKDNKPEANEEGSTDKDNQSDNKSGTNEEESVDDLKQNPNEANKKEFVDDLKHNPNGEESNPEDTKASTNKSEEASSEPPDDSGQSNDKPQMSSEDVTPSV